MRLRPAVAGPVDSARLRRFAVVGSLGYVFVLSISWYWVHGGFREVFGLLFTSQVGPWLVYAFGGGALVGAALAVSVVRYRLVAPLAVALVLYGVAMFQMWQAMQRPYALLPGTPYDLFLVGWPVVFGLAAVSGFAELLVRGR